MEQEALLARVTGFSDKIEAMTEGADRPAIMVPAEALVDVSQKLHDDPELSFDMLCTHTAIDHLGDGNLELVYQLYSTKHCHYLLVSVTVSRDEAVVPSVSKVWRIAEWQEREVYDMFGVLYENHPDLRRVFLEDDWEGFPLRKDYKDDFMLDMEESK